jgi:hypothetical protein
MNYIKIDENSYIEYDEATQKSLMFNKQKIEEELENLSVRLDEIPKSPSDEELLEWARTNYKYVDYSVETKFINDRIEKIKSLLENIEGLKVIGDKK